MDKVPIKFTLKSDSLAENALLTVDSKYFRLSKKEQFKGLWNLFKLIINPSNK